MAKMVNGRGTGGFIGAQTREEKQKRKRRRNMAISSLLPWKTKSLRSELGQFGQLGRWGGMGFEPLSLLQQELNRVFDETLGRAGEPGTTGRIFAPVLEVSEDEKEVRVSAELPGIEAKDLDLDVADDVLTIRGEKRAEREVKERGCVFTERSFGSFERQIALPSEVDHTQCKAQFKNGVLEVTMPKLPGAQSRHHKVKVE